MDSTWSIYGLIWKRQVKASADAEKHFRKRSKGTEAVAEHGANLFSQFSLNRPRKASDVACVLASHALPCLVQW
jgi:hypothetical protein